MLRRSITIAHDQMSKYYVLQLVYRNLSTATIVTVTIGESTTILKLILESILKSRIG